MTARELILIIEDEPHDSELLQYALSWGRIRNPFQILRDAGEAIKYLTGHGKFGDRAAFPRPGAIILDLYLPGMSGLEFLQWLKEHPEYRVVPTIVFTTSDRESDMKQAYNLGADAYLIKPLMFDDLVPEIRSTLTQWSTESLALRTGKRTRAEL